jgi:hypothetical protein
MQVLEGILRHYRRPKQDKEDKELTLEGEENEVPELLRLLDVEMKKEVQDRATCLMIIRLNVDNTLASTILTFLRNCSVTEGLEMESLNCILTGKTRCPGLALACCHRACEQQARLAYCFQSQCDYRFTSSLGYSS